MVDLTAGALVVLVVGTDEWAIEQAADSVASAGHGVVRCHDAGDAAFPCNALREGRTCPLDAGFDVVLDMRSRPAEEPTAGEIGVVCALRTGHPLVTAGIVRRGPFEEWTAVEVGAHDDVVDAVERAATRFADTPPR